jgi:hypothetical protein
MGPGVIAIVVAVAALALAAEWFARAGRLADYPLFRRSEAVGYHFLPGAQGTMRGRYRWRINAMGLRSDCDRAPGPDSIVLLGDSTVEDGVYTDQRETLAARLAEATGRDVHPVACPAWSLENMFAFLRANPALLGAGTVVFVTNSQDLAALNRWETESAQPTRRPVSHACYALMRATHLVRRKAFPFLFPPWADEADRTWERSLEQFLAGYRGRVVWAFYPLPFELERGETPCAELRPLLAGRAETFDIAAVPGWSLARYADEVHPNRAGRRLLLDALLAALRQPGGTA